MSSATLPTETDVLVVGAGPAGSAAAAWLARAGLDVVLADATTYPRDKTCGDGLTPRAVHELSRLGLEDWLRAHTVNQGLRAHGFGQVLHLPWPGGSLPSWGSAVARTELDDHLRTTALKAGAIGLLVVTVAGAAPSASRSPADGSSSPTACAPRSARCWGVSGTATPSTASPAAPTSPPR